MFKNLLVYRLGPGGAASAAELEERLDAARFVPCGATQAASAGWVSPRGKAHGPLVEVIGGQWLLRLMTEARLLPGAVVKRKVDELAKKIEDETGRKPGKKLKKELKDEVLLELLPQAFTKQASVPVWLDPEARLLMIDAGSAARADVAITELVKAADGLAVLPLHTLGSPVALMTDWLSGGEPPAVFTVDRECELKSADESKSAVRYARHPLDIDEVRQHIAQGKLPTRLAMTWNSRVSFVLTEAMQVKKLTFLDVVFEGHQPDKDDAFDADAAIATTELAALIPDLIDALGGEKPPAQ
ncbi:MAG: recombination-associated protein RdgC [Burkholderiales bacterium]